MNYFVNQIPILPYYTVITTAPLTLILLVHSVYELRINEVRKPVQSFFIYFSAHKQSAPTKSM